MPTPATNVRLTESEKADLEALRVHHGLPSAAAAIRKSIEIARFMMEEDRRRMAEVARLSVASEARKATRKKNPK